MYNIDEKFKDASPEQTVARILEILAENGLHASERWAESGVSDCFSVHVTIDGTECGTYGKGITRPLARASGYAELMERLQNGFLYLKPLKRPDRRLLTQDELFSESGPFFARLAEKLTEKEGWHFTAERLIQIAAQLEPGDRLDCTPYYSVTEDRQIPIPQRFLIDLCGSNGLSAGNSPAEAMVQGFSEIQERYCQYQFLFRHLTPPDVPEDYLAQFSVASRIIRSIRAAGYDVVVKDCSLGEGYPVVCTAVIDRKTHQYHVHLGANPVFEIALERSLTEIFQGRNLSALAIDRGFSTGDRPDSETYLVSFGQGHSIFPPEFFLDTPTRPFVPFPDRSGMTNPELLGYIREFLRAHSLELLVRNESYLGFNAWRLYVPGRTEVLTRDFAGETPQVVLRRDTRNVRQNLLAADRADCQQYLEYFRRCPKPKQIRLQFTRITNLGLKLSRDDDTFFAYLTAAYAAWKCEDHATCLENLNIALPYFGGSDQNKAYFEALQCWLQLEQAGYEPDAIRQILLRFYDVQQTALLLTMIQAGRNPLEFSLPVCSGDCERCRLKDRCLMPARENLVEVVNRGAAKFDAAQAMADLHTLFAGL